MVRNKEMVYGQFYTGKRVPVLLVQNEKILVEVGFTLYVITGINTDFTRPDRDNYVTVKCDGQHRLASICRMVIQKVSYRYT